MVIVTVADPRFPPESVTSVLMMWAPTLSEEMLNDAPLPIASFNFR